MPQKKSMNFDIRKTNILIAIWIIYFVVYFSFKRYGIIIPYLSLKYGLTLKVLGIIAGFSSFAYLAGLFLHDYVYRHTDLRILTILCIVISIIANMFFGFIALVFPLFFLVGLNDLSKLMVWIRLIKNISGWLNEDDKYTQYPLLSKVLVAIGAIVSITSTVMTTNRILAVPSFIGLIIPVLLLVFLGAIIYIGISYPVFRSKNNLKKILKHHKTKQEEIIFLEREPVSY